MPGAPPDPVSLEVYRHLFASLAEEMGAALRRAAFSPNIKERRDYSCALFSADGTAVALGDHMPVHLGAMPMSVRAALDELGELRSGDVVCLNDPFQGGTHLPDITLVAPVHEEESGRLLGYVASRAHHSDVGGSAPGSMPLAREIYQEGLRIPPVRIRDRGRDCDGVWSIILANVRTPVERTGDLEAQMAALHTGSRRLLELASERGADAVTGAMAGLIAYADRLVAAGIARMPRGRHSAEEAIEDDGFGSGPLPVRVAVEVTGTARNPRLIIDFAGTAPQAPGGVNAVAAITASATRYVVRCIIEHLLDETLPAGGGSMSAIELRLPPGSLVDAQLPASVAAGNVETSQRITDALLQAFRQTLPEHVPALSQGTMNNLTAGGRDPRTDEAFTYYETMGGGMGGGPSGPGLSGVHTHMSNSLNTPVEALEHAYPLRVTEYSIRAGSGGRGIHPGGDGLRRDLRFLAEAEVTILSERRNEGPPGAAGGGSGARGENILIRGTREKILPGKVTLRVAPGEVVSIRSPGGGGWGAPGDAS